MSNNKSMFVGACILSIIASTAQGITLAELEKKNNEAIELDIKIALAAKETELALKKPPPPPVVISTPPVQRPKISPSSEIDGLALTEVFGDVANSSARFEINGAQITRKKYETIYSWTIQQISKDQVVLTRAGKNRKDDLVKTIYKSAARPSWGQQTPVGRDAFRNVPGQAPMNPGSPIGPIGVIQQR